MEDRKKKLLFVIPSLNTGGAEKSLWGLLKYFDYNKYDVDVYPYAEDGFYSSSLDERVNVIGDNKLYRDMFYNKLGTACKLLIKSHHPFLACLRIVWGLLPYVYKLLHIEYHRNSALDWYIPRSAMMKSKKHYDAAIGYMEGGSNYYVADCVDADTKIGWIHTDYSITHPNIRLDKRKLVKFKSIVTVSDNSKREIVKLIPAFAKKVIIIPNVIDTLKIDRLKQLPAEKMSESNKIKIVSVGRLVKLKGFDICIDAAAILKKNGLCFEWYFIGDGPEKENLTNQINDLHLVDCCFLTGPTDNPYAYVNRADICVQMSEYEGRSLVIEEAKYLAKPIIVSDIGSYREMIQNGKTGIIVDRDKKALYTAIIELLSNDELRDFISNNLEEFRLDDQAIVKEVEKLIS